MPKCICGQPYKFIPKTPSPTTASESSWLNPGGCGKPRRNSAREFELIRRTSSFQVTSKQFDACLPRPGNEVGAWRVKALTLRRSALLHPIDCHRAMDSALDTLAFR